MHVTHLADQSAPARLAADLSNGIVQQTPSSSIACSRITNFCTLPVTVIG